MNSNKSKNYNPNDEVEIDLLELLYYFKGKLFFIITAFIIGAIIAGSITKFAIPKKYTATSTMYMVSASTNSVVDISDLNIGSALSSDYKKFDDPRVITLDGDSIAARILGLPITNTILLGAFAAISNEISLEEIYEAIRQTMPRRLHEKNIAAVKAAYEEVVA